MDSMCPAISQPSVLWAQPSALAPFAAQLQWVPLSLPGPELCFVPLGAAVPPWAYLGTFVSSHWVHVSLQLAFWFCRLSKAMMMWASWIVTERDVDF